MSRDKTGAVIIVAAASLVASVLTGCTSASPASAPPAPVATAPATAPLAVGTTQAPGTTTSLPPPLPEPSPPLASPGDNRVFVLGDSVILGAKLEVPRELVGWNVTFDAQESRLINHGLGVLKQRKKDFENLSALARADLEKAYADAGKPPPKPDPPASVTDVFGHVFVLHLCTNYLAGSGFDYFIDQYMSYLEGASRVVWVTCGEWSDGQVEANRLIRAAAARYPTIVVADWASFAPTPGYTYEDGIHLTDPGRASIAQVVARAVGTAPTPLPPPTTTTRPKPTSTTTTTPIPEPVP